MSLTKNKIIVFDIRRRQPIRTFESNECDFNHFIDLPHSTIDNLLSSIIVYLFFSFFFQYEIVELIFERVFNEMKFKVGLRGWESNVVHIAHVFVESVEPNLKRLVDVEVLESRKFIHSNY